MLTTIAGETIALLPGRALYWAAQRMLIVADIHFGKAATFRAKGVPVPHGTTSANLEALDALLAANPSEHILFLGDFLHAKAAHAPRTLNSIRAWRSRHAALTLTLVRGNHDSHAGDPPPDLSITAVDEPFRIGPFAFCHHPQHCEGAYVLAGHVHPVFRLAAGRDAVRLPCFVFDRDQGLLPSFGAFTGGHPVQSEAGKKIYVAAGERVFQIPG